MDGWLEMWGRMAYHADAWDGVVACCSSIEDGFCFVGGSCRHGWRSKNLGRWVKRN